MAAASARMGKSQIVMRPSTAKDTLKFRARLRLASWRVEWRA